MKKSDSITKLAEALAKAQAEMPVVRMNASNPFLKNKFADLGAVIDASRPTLAKYGLSLSQFPTGDGDKIGITNILMHTSGEWLEDTVYLTLSDEKGKSAAQTAGSVITYLRRYSWAAMLGMYADEDTDGHAGNGTKPEVKQTVTVATKTEKTEAEKKQIAMDLYADLSKRARAVNITIPALDAGKNSEQMKAQYNEQKAFVVDAETQAKVGK